MAQNNTIAHSMPDIAALAELFKTAYFRYQFYTAEARPMLSRHL